MPTLKDLFGQSFAKGQQAGAQGYQKQLQDVTDNAKNDRETRLAAQTLVRDLEKSTGGTRIGDLSDALKSMKDLMKSDSPYTIGQVQTGLARLSGEKGVLSDADIQRALRSTARQDISRLGAYLGLSDMPSLSEDQRGAVEQLIKDAENRLQQRIAGGRESVQQRAGLYGLTPEQTSQAIQSYGSQYKPSAPMQQTPPGPPPAPPNDQELTPEEQMELEALRKEFSGGGR